MSIRKMLLNRINEYVADEVRAGREIRFRNRAEFLNLIDTEALLKLLFSVPKADSARIGVNAFRCVPGFSDEDIRGWLIDLFTRTHYTGLSRNEARLIASLLLTGDYTKAAQTVKETAERFFRDDVVPIFKEIRYKYETSTPALTISTDKAIKLTKIVIATALTLERTEVVKHLGVTQYDAQLRADIGVYPPANPLFEVYVVATGAGNLESQGALMHFFRKVKPKFAFFVGVGGGIKDNSIGDVAYSTKVHYYEAGKEEDDGTKSRPASERSSEDLVQLAHRVAEHPWHGSINAVSLEQRRATPAVFASGEQVLASTAPNALVYQQIKKEYNDSQIVDMEAYGFLHACRAERVPHSMVIRGVSDLLQKKEESDKAGNQPLAASNAAAFVFALIRLCPEIIKPKKRKK